MTTMNFRDYFKMPALEAERKLADAGYRVAQSELKMPSASADQVGDTKHLQGDIDAALHFVVFDNEQAKREALTYPVLAHAVRRARSTGRANTRLAFEQKLAGTTGSGIADYIILDLVPLIVIEAKEDNIERGSYQLAAEVAAAAQMHGQEQLTGVVTSGNVWRFVQVDEANKTIQLDIQRYYLPQNVTGILGVLIHLLLKA